MDKVVVFADHNIGYLLVDYLYDNQNDFIIERIYTNNNEQAWWKKVIENEKFSGKVMLYDPDLTIRDVMRLMPEYLLLLSWKHIIPGSLITSVKKKVVNLHYSLLPDHRGVYPINNAIMSGDKVTGVTYHVVNKGIDSGDVIAQQKTEIKWTDDVSTLLERLDVIAFDLFKKIWPIRDKWSEMQKPQIETRSYNSLKRFEHSNCIDLTKSYQASELINLLRSKMFKEQTSSFFIDEKSDEKFVVKIQIEKVELL